MEHQMNLYHNAFTLLKNKKKKIEMRLYDEKRRKLQKGDLIVFTDVETKETLVLVVAALHLFPNFKELYQKFSKETLGYLPNEEASYEDMYSYYSEEAIAKYGVVGIELISKKEYDRGIRIENTMNLLRKFCDENLPEEDAKEIKAILK